MESDKNKNMWMWVVVAVLVIGAIIAMVMSSKDDDVAVVTDANKEVAMDADDKLAPPEGVEDTTEGSVNKAAAPAATLTYQQALEKYKDRRIQFNDSCSAVPNNVTYKDNTGIMLDNRSAQTRTIKVGGTYTVKGYGFKIVTLPNITTQKTFLVDCDGQQNVATILVQE
ncbi:MAG: hypothetical protein M3Q34_00350 [bacterium]|nr:hypothetical protein [bacterium]